MRLREMVKTLLMIALILSIVAMAAQLWLFGTLSLSETGDAVETLRVALLSAGFQDLAERLTEHTPQGTTVDYSERFAYPSSVTVLTSGGALSSAYRTETTRECYRQLAEGATAALSGTAEAMEQGQWEKLIAESQGILVDYGRPLSLSLLMQMAGRTCDGRLAETAFRYALFVTGGEETYACLRTSDGAFYKLSGGAADLTQTAATLAARADMTPVALLGRAATIERRLVSEQFWENLQLPAENLYPAIDGREPQVYYATNPVYHAQNGFNTWRLQEILTQFRYNPSTVNRYTEKNGTQVYVENYGSLRITTEGVLHYSTTQTAKGIPLSAYFESEAKDYYTLREVVSAALMFTTSLKQEVVGGNGGELRFREAYYDQDEQALYLEFDYVMDGITVKIAADDGQTAALRLRYQNGFFTGCDAVFRAYEPAGADFEMLYVLKAAEALSYAGEEPRQMEVLYQDALAEEERALVPSYYAVKEE